MNTDWTICHADKVYFYIFDINFFFYTLPGNVPSSQGNLFSPDVIFDVSSTRGSLELERADMTLKTNIRDSTEAALWV